MQQINWKLEFTVFLLLIIIFISSVERPVVTPSTHNVSLGTSVTFECTEFGSPPFTYQWFIRNTSMEGSDKLLVGEGNNTYNISSVLYNQTGLYFCEASNMLGILSNSTPASLIGELFFFSAYTYVGHCCMLSLNKFLAHSL